MSKEAVLIIIDITDSMKLNLESTKKAISSLIQQKLLYCKRDELGIILLGTSTTSNPLNNNDGGYDYISVISDIKPPKMDIFNLLNDINCESVKYADSFDSVIVAIHLLDDRCKKLKWDKKIFLFTNATSPISNQEQMDTIVDIMNQKEIGLYVFCYEFGLKSDIYEHKSNSEEFLTNFCQKTNGSVIQLTHDSVLQLVQSRSISQVTSYRGPLKIGSIEIPVYCYSKTKLMNLPSLKKESTVGNGAVKMSRTYWNKAQDVNKEILDDERVQAYYYGKDKIPFSSVDATALKYKVEKELSAIAFIERSKIPRHFFMGGVDIIIPEPNNENAAQSLASFVKACTDFDVKKVILVRFVKRNNSPPKFGVLSPFNIDDEYGFYFNLLPFSEDIRDFAFGTFEQNPNLKITSAQKEATKNLVSSMRLKTVDDDEILDPDFTFNPVLQRFYKTVQCKAFDADAGIAPLDEDIRKYLEPDEQIFAKSQEYITQFKDNFKLEKNIVEKTNKKRRWKELVVVDPNANKPSIFDNAGDDEKEIVFDVVAAIESVSASNPVDTFKQMLIDNPDLIEKASTEMWNIINDSVFKSLGNATYPKAISCIQIMRSSFIQLGRPELFNRDFIKLKQRCDIKSPEFVALLKSKEITLINRNEAGSSEYSQEDAESYMSAELKPILVKVEEQIVEAADDFDGLE